MAGYIGTQAVSVNTTSATISDDLAVGDDATIAGDATVTGVITGSTVEATGDTAAGDNAAMGYTAAEGLILTGQGSTSDITLKNDADATVFTVPTGTDDILFPDNAKAMFGAGSDLQIFHNGTDSVIQEVVNNRRFLIGGDEIAVRTGDLSEDMAKFIADGAVELYHNNAKKLETTSSGVAITTTLKIVDTELAEASDNFSINIQTGNNDFYVKSGGTIFAAFKGSPKDLQLTSGDLVFGTAGKGVVLGATTNTAANTLDDYEEGTWTPTVNRGYDAVGYSSQVGRYTKIGNTVRAFAQMTLAAGSTTGNSAGVRMIGLPFATNSNGGVYTVGFHYMNAIDSLGLESVWITFPNESAAYLYQKTATGVSVISGSTAGDDINVFLTMVYEAA